MKEYKITYWAIILFSTLLATGCEEDEIRTIKRIDNICSDASIEQRAEFILACVDSANPKSDEEPEDWIRICQEMAEDTYCDKQTVSVEQFRPGHGFWRDSKVTVVK